MSSLVEYVTAINALLAGVTDKAYFGEEQLARHRPRRSFVWYLLRDEFEAPHGHGREAEQVKNLVATFVVRCVGKDFAEAEMLRAALVAAAGKALGGFSQRSIRLGPAEWYARSDNQDGFVCDQQLGLVVPFHLAKLPPGPNEDAADGAHTTALINARAIESSDVVETLPP